MIYVCIVYSFVIIKFPSKCVQDLKNINVFYACALAEGELLLVSAETEVYLFLL